VLSYLFGAVARNSSFIFWSVGFIRWQKMNVLFVRLAFFA
jgi:hypothetical protein